MKYNKSSLTSIVDIINRTIKNTETYGKIKERFVKDVMLNFNTTPAGNVSKKQGTKLKGNWIDLTAKQISLLNQALHVDIQIQAETRAIQNSVDWTDVNVWGEEIAGWHKDYFWDIYNSVTDYIGGADTLYSDEIIDVIRNELDKGSTKRQIIKHIAEIKDNSKDDANFAFNLSSTTAPKLRNNFNSDFGI